MLELKISIQPSFFFFFFYLKGTLKKINKQIKPPFVTDIGTLGLGEAGGWNMGMPLEKAEQT